MIQRTTKKIESLTDAVYERTGAIKEFKLCEGLPAVDLQSVGRHVYAEEGGAPFFEVEVVDPAEDYLVLMRKAFDLDALKALLARDDMSFVFDGMHGVAGPYAASLLEALAYASGIGHDPSRIDVGASGSRNRSPRAAGGHRHLYLTFLSCS